MQRQRGEVGVGGGAREGGISLVLGSTYTGLAPAPQNPQIWGRTSGTRAFAQLADPLQAASFAISVLPPCSSICTCASTIWACGLHFRVHQ